MFGIESLSVIVPLIIGLTQAIKLLGLPSKFSALVSLAFGLVAAFLFPVALLRDTILFGLIAGLSASGLWSGVKNGLGATNLIKK